MRLIPHVWPVDLRQAAGVLGCVLLLSGGAAAQAPDQRRALDAYRDSLASTTDSLALSRQEAALLNEVKRSRKDPFLHLRLGHLALRQGELGGADHFDDAASEFKFAGELAPQFPYAWYGLGQAEFALGTRLGGSREPSTPLARDAMSRASLAFAKAVALEPGLAPRLEEIARRAVRAKLPGRAEVIRDALRKALSESRAARPGRLLLALGRIQRELGDTGATASFEQYLASGEDAPLALIEVGRTRLLKGNLSGQVDYLEGAASDDPASVSEVRADLSPLATERELADFDLRRGVMRADMVRRFWTTRDRLELRRDGERLAEHLRRLAVARREFLLIDEEGRERFDDRGQVFVRHGEPDERAGFTIPGVEPNESWRYRRGGNDLVLHFAARNTPGDFHLIESVLDVSDVRASVAGRPGAAPGTLPGSNEMQLLRSRASIAPLYRQLPTGRADQVADYLDRERSLGRRGILNATRTDSYAPRFALELNAWGGFVVAGGSAAQPMVQVLFAIPGYAIEPASGVVGVVYPVRVRFVALDSAGTVVASVDTLTRIEPQDRIPANRSLMAQVSVPVLPGRLVVHAAVQYGDQAGTALGVDSVIVPSPGSGTLALGDPLVGSRRGRLLVPVGDGTRIAIAPGGVVHRSDGMDLAIDLFGLAPNGEAELKVLVAPVEENGEEAGLRWRPYPEGNAVAKVRRGGGAGPIVRWRAQLSLENLKAGSWWIAVEATDPTGRNARREARFTVEVP